jgi:hypothetical protein
MWASDCHSTTLSFLAAAVRRLCNTQVQQRAVRTLHCTIIAGLPPCLCIRTSHGWPGPTVPAAVGPAHAAAAVRKCIKHITAKQQRHNAYQAIRRWSQLCTIDCRLQQQWALGRPAPAAAPARKCSKHVTAKQRCSKSAKQQGSSAVALSAQ